MKDTFYDNFNEKPKKHVLHLLRFHFIYALRVRLNFKGSLSTVEPPTFTAKPSTSTLQPSTHADRSSKSAIQPSTTTSQADVSFNDEDNVTDTSSTPVDDSIEKNFELNEKI
ncbi:hypothetical protein PV325_004998 [Microctonus aethiopoides]|nr:hypothetical protein PV325_004998 [Microctonus aethiopoides]